MTHNQDTPEELRLPHPTIVRYFPANRPNVVNGFPIVDLADGLDYSQAGDVAHMLSILLPREVRELNEALGGETSPTGVFDSIERGIEPMNSVSHGDAWQQAVREGKDNIVTAYAHDAAAAWFLSRLKGFNLPMLRAYLGGVSTDYVGQMLLLVDSYLAASGHEYPTLPQGLDRLTATRLDRGGHGPWFDRWLERWEAS